MIKKSAPFLLVLLLLFGCSYGKPVAREDLENTTLHKFFESPLETTDPLEAIDVVSGHIIIQVYDTLFEVDSSHNVQPHLSYCQVWCMRG